MPSRDYFTYDERPDGQSIDVGSPQSTDWNQFGDFFTVKGVILSEQPDGPAMLAEGYSQANAKFQEAADQLDARAHEFNGAWSSGPASKIYFWFAGATLYGLDHWVENLDEKIQRLSDLSGQIADAHAEAEDLEQRFKAEYLSRAPAGAAFYGFPPNLELDNPAMDEEEEAKLKAQIAAIYEEVHAKYLKMIIKLGERLARQFVEAAKWMDGSAGKVPVEFQGPDVADPWLPYTPEQLSPSLMPIQLRPRIDQQFSLTEFSIDESPSMVEPYDPGAERVTMRLDPLSTEVLPPNLQTRQVEPTGFGPTLINQSGDPQFSSPERDGVGAPLPVGRGVMRLGFLPLLPTGDTAPPRRAESGRPSTALPSATAPGAALAGRFGELAPPPGEAMPAALSARGAQQLPVGVELPSTTVGGSAPLGGAAAVGGSADGPMATPTAAAAGFHHVLGARSAMMAATSEAGSGRARPTAPERTGVLGERRGEPREPVRQQKPEKSRGDSSAAGTRPVDGSSPAVRRSVA